MIHPDVWTKYILFSAKQLVTLDYKLIDISLPKGPATTDGQLSLLGFRIFLRAKTTAVSGATANQPQYRNSQLIGIQAYHWTTPDTIPREIATIITTAPASSSIIILHQ
jgi:hypothetical protein